MAGAAWVWAAMLLALPAAAAPSPVVDAPAGRLSGEAMGTVHVFKGIPYAVPPVGALRWKAPPIAGESAGALSVMYRMAAPSARNLFAKAVMQSACMAFEEAPKPRANLMPGMYEFNERIVCRRRANGGIPWHWNVGLASPPLPAEPARCQ